MKNTFLNEHDTKSALSEFILKSDRLSMGEKCREFELAFSEFQSRKYSVLFNSGGSANLALIQALKNLGRIKEGDKIGFSALTWSTNVMPLLQMGLVPVPIDCSVKTLNVMSDSLLKRLEEEEIKMMFLTNVLGFVGDIEKIHSVCRERNIILIEDNCESLGTETFSGKAGNFGVASTFSFFVGHHMSSIEGGMACTDDEELEIMLRVVRANGWDRNLAAHQQIRLRKQHKIDSEFYAKYTFYDLGYNLRPTEITGFLGMYQLQFLRKNIEQRERNFKTIEKTIAANPDLIALSHDHIRILSSFALPVICKKASLRDKYISQFSGAGIEIRPMIAGNVQHQPFFRKYVSKTYDLVGAEFLHQNAFYCGNYPELSIEDIKRIKSCLIQF